jgi:hypothetical protein
LNALDIVVSVIIVKPDWFEYRLEFLDYNFI